MTLSDDVLISIVDDDSSLREGLRAFIQSLGYKAVAFGSAELFLESGLLAQTRCLISDLQMPGLSGLGLQKELQSRGYRIPIVIITAYPDEKCRRQALDARAVGFLSKPFEEEALVGCLTAAISRDK